MRFSAVLIFLFVTAAMANKDDKPNTMNYGKRSKVIVLSMGGLSAHFLTEFNMVKTLDHYNKLARLKYFSPVRPCKGLVNHFSIATGLYANGHGVIDNCKYDEQKGKCEYGKPNEDIMPIWIENQQEGGGISAVMNWPGSEKRYSGKRPTYIVEDDKVEE